MSEDLSLLEAWRGGDHRAARELLDRYFPLLYRFFRNKVDGDIDDLVQATFLACTRTRTEVHTSFRAWLLTIARHELYAHLRKQQRRRTDQELDAEIHSVVDTGTSPSVAAARAQRNRLLLAALRHLPLELQVILELHYWEDLSTSEMADVVGIPQGTVKSRLRRAREQLEAQISAHEADPALVRSTLQDLDGWARKLREQPR